MPPCKCQPDSYPFHCSRHACRKTEHWHKLCRTRDDYFQLWEEGRGPGQQSHHEPGFWRKVRNYFRALLRHIHNRGRQASRRVYRQRIAVCHVCPSLDADRMVCREKKCGCKVERKARWASESCPLRKWPGDKAATEHREHEKTLHTQPTADTTRQATATS